MLMGDVSHLNTRSILICVSLTTPALTEFRRLVYFYLYASIMCARMDAFLNLEYPVEVAVVAPLY